MLGSNKSEDKAKGIYSGLTLILLTATKAWLQFLMVVSYTAVVPQWQVNPHTSSVCKVSFPSSHKQHWNQNYFTLGYLQLSSYVVANYIV